MNIQKKYLILLVITLIVSVFFIINIVQYELLKPEKVSVSSFIGKNFSILDKKYANLTDSKYRDIIVNYIYKTNSFENELTPYFQYFTVLSFNSKKKKWQNFFNYRLENYEPYNNYKLDIAKKLLKDKDAFILSKAEGSGAFLDYIVFGFQDDQIKIFLKRNGLFQGSIKFDNDNIIEDSGNNTTIFNYDGKRFTGTKLIQQPYIPHSTNDVLIEYYIDKKGNVDVLKEITLKLGQKLILSQVSESGISSRILYDNRVIESISSENTFIAKEEGFTTITIIPNGYDWDKKAEITVHVEK